MAQTVLKLGAGLLLALSLTGCLSAAGAAAGAAVGVTKTVVEVPVRLGAMAADAATGGNCKENDEKCKEQEAGEEDI